ncbi:hypothetical protein NQD34_003609 [Periophthalmus magnuspinnatus]|nr:hypothetical protein NQD34_003609 [Periophthalmus magnuspinnatus]
MTQCLRIPSRFTKLHHSLGVLASVRWSSSLRPGPLLSADPCRALINEKIWIRARFLPPLSPVTVSTQMYSEERDLWQSYAHYNTDSEGTVNLCRDASVGGSYVGCEPMGLFWALHPAPGEREGLRQVKKCTTDKPAFKVSVSEGHVSLGHRGAEHSELASISIERSYMAPGVKRVEIRENGLVGTLFLPPGPGPFPAVLDLFGMAGGLMEFRSALFASKGYASFSLAYFGHKDLPGPLKTINVGNAYFKTAFQFLQDHDQICQDRVGVLGISYGGYLTLRVSTLPGVKPACLICINGPVGSTAPLSDDEGRTKAFEFEQKHWNFTPEGYVIFKDISFPENLPEPLRVKIEEIPCPVMYIVSEDDLSACAAENADVLEQTLNACGKGHLFTRLSYPGAGHLIEPAYSPHTRLSLWTVKPEKLFVLWGGQPAPHAVAQEDAWRRIHQFLDTHLRGDRVH